MSFFLKCDNKDNFNNFVTWNTIIIFSFSKTFRGRLSPSPFLMVLPVFQKSENKATIKVHTIAGHLNLIIINMVSDRRSNLYKYKRCIDTSHMNIPHRIMKPEFLMVTMETDSRTNQVIFRCNSNLEPKLKRGVHDSIEYVFLHMCQISDQYDFSFLSNVDTRTPRLRKFTFWDIGR